MPRAFPAVLAYASPATAPGMIPVPRWLMALPFNAWALALALGLTALLSGSHRGRVLILGVSGLLAGVQLLVLVPLTVRWILVAKPSRPVRLLVIAAGQVGIFLAMLTWMR